jgi:hypothetical protein
MIERGEHIMMNGSRYWVVGGEYTCCAFENLIRGTEKLMGPFDSREEAEQAWRRLSEEHRPRAQMRFTIAREGSLRTA